MTKASELALEVLLGEGLIERTGSWYRFKESLPVEVRVIQQSEVNAMVVVPGKLPWLNVRQVAESDYSPKTPEQRILCAFKMAKGMDWRDRAWDKAMFSRYVRPAKQLLGAFDDEHSAAEFLLQYGDEMKEAGLDWGLDAAVRKAWNTRGEREASR